MSDGYLVSDNNDSEQHNAWKISAWHDQPIVSRKIDKFRPEFLTTGLARDLIDMNTCIKASDMPVKAFDNVFFKFFKKHHYQHIYLYHIILAESVFKKYKISIKLDNFFSSLFPDRFLKNVYV